MALLERYGGDNSEAGFTFQTDWKSFFWKRGCDINFEPEERSLADMKKELTGKITFIAQVFSFLSGLLVIVQVTFILALIFSFVTWLVYFDRWAKRRTPGHFSERKFAERQLDESQLSSLSTAVNVSIENPLMRSLDFGHGFSIVLACH